MPNSKSSSKKQTNQKRTNRAVKQYEREVYESNGNVFKDMGKRDDVSVNLLMRSKLMIEIEEAVKSNGLTQAQAAKIIGVAQPRIAELFASRIDLFTLDTLVKYLNKLGKKVTITVADGEVA